MSSIENPYRRLPSILTPDHYYGSGKAVRFALEQISGVKLDQKGRILDNRGRIVVNEHYQTSNPKYFAAGDAVNGGVEVVNAAAEAKKAAHGIDQYLKK